MGVVAFHGHHHGSGGSSNATAATQQAANICAEAESAAARLPQSPGSVAAGVRLEHRILAIYDHEISRLEALAPEESDSFQAGVATDRKMLHAEAHTDFSQAEVPVCEKSLG